MKTLLTTIITVIIMIYSPLSMAQQHHRHQHHQRIHQYDYVVPALITGIGTALVVERMNRRNDTREIIVEEVIVPNNNIRCTQWREIITNNGKIFRERICTEYPN